MFESDHDHQILFGLMASQMNLLSESELAGVLQSWREDPSSSLRQVLRDQRMLDESSLLLVDAAVERQLQMCGGDTRRCLDGLARTSELRALHTPQEARGLAETVADGEPPDQGETTAILGEAPSNGNSYQILRPLARGGLGELFVAQDTSLNREVALKIIQQPIAGNPQQLARFLQEAEITGGLEHPGIVPIYALGQNADGRPYYTMRLVKGVTLGERIRKFHRAGSIRSNPLEFRQLLNHFVRVCEIVEYAHSRGVLHRDLKPANIMLGKYGETLVVDWGLAKPIDRPEQESALHDDEAMLRPSSGSSVQESMHGKALGTPKYMSPEQALGQIDQIGPGTDVYSLGATLYCILTGRSPLAGVNDVGEILGRVARGEIVPASQIAPALPATLGKICRKAMAVRAEDRYASARDLADDIEQWLADEPTRGVAESFGNRLGRWRRKHRTLIRVGGLAMFAVTLTAVAAAVGINTARQRAEERRLRAIELGQIAETQRQAAARQRDEAQRLSTRLTLDRALGLLEAGDHRAGLLWLARGLRAVNQHDPGSAIERVIRINMEAWSHEVHRLRACLEHQGRVGVIAWSPTGACFATGSDDGRAQLWDPATGSPLSPALVHVGPVRVLAFSPDGATLASGSEDQTARFWNVATGLARGEPMRHQGPVTSLVFVPDGGALITGSSDGMIRFWSIRTSQLQGQPRAHGHPVEKVLITPDGKTVISGGEEGSALLWNLADPQPRGSLPGLKGSLRTIALSPDGTLLATAADDRRLRLWKVPGGELLATTSIPAHGEALLDLAFSPDGSKLATSSYDTSSRIFRVPDLEPLSPAPEATRPRLGHCVQPGQLDADHGGRRQPGTDLGHGDIRQGRGHASALPASPRSGLQRRWPDHRDGLRRRHYPDLGAWRRFCGRPADGAFHGGSRPRCPTGRKGHRHRHRRRDPLALGCGQHPAHRPANGRRGGWPPAGRELQRQRSAGLGRRRRAGAALERQDSGSDRATHPADLQGAQSRPQSGWYGAGGRRPVRPLRLLGSSDRPALASPPALARAITSLAFNPDGTRLFVGHSLGDGRIWDMTTFKPVGDPIRHDGAIQCSAFSPDGRRLATASYDKTARLWNVETQKPIGEPMRHRGYVWSVKFNSDGQRLLTGSFDETARIWDGHTGRPIGEPMNHGEMIYGAWFSPDGSMVLTHGRSPEGRLWDASTSRPLGVPLRHLGSIYRAAFVPARPLIATASADATARLWNVPKVLTGPADELAEQTNLTTGMELGEDNVVRIMDAAAWNARYAAMQCAGLTP